QYRFGYASAAVTADVAGDLTAAGGMADVNCLAQIELFRQGRKVVGVRVHVVTGPRLTRSSMSAPVMRDRAVAARSEEQHLAVPGIRGKRPTVAESDRLSFLRAPIFVEDLCAIACGYEAHDHLPAGSSEVRCEQTRSSRAIMERYNPATSRPGSRSGQEAAAASKLLKCRDFGAGRCGDRRGTRPAIPASYPQSRPFTELPPHGQ